MFAVIRTGGKQYKVAKDDVISVERLAAEPGATIELGEVLRIGEGGEGATGTPFLDGALARATACARLQKAQSTFTRVSPGGLTFRLSLRRGRRRKPANSRSPKRTEAR